MILYFLYKTINKLINYIISVPLKWDELNN